MEIWDSFYRIHNRIIKQSHDNCSYLFYWREIKAICLLLCAGLFLGCRGSTWPSQVCCWCQMEQGWADALKSDSWLSLTDHPAAACFQGRRIALLQLREGWSTSQGPGKLLVNWVAAFERIKQMVVISSDFFLFCTIWPNPNNMFRTQSMNPVWIYLHPCSILSELGCHSSQGGRGQKVTPEWLIRESLKRDKRRHSITLGDQPQVIRQQQQQRQHASASVCSFQVVLELLQYRLFPHSVTRAPHFHLFSSFQTEINILPS